MVDSYIKKIFENEFGKLAQRFTVIEIPLSKAKSDKRPEVAMPGVYVFWEGDKVIKVGRSLDNSRKRALEHIPANTGGIMAAHGNDPSVKLMLFNLKDRSDIHWVCALEVFLETKLKEGKNLAIPSGRIG